MNKTEKKLDDEIEPYDDDLFDSELDKLFVGDSLDDKLNEQLSDAEKNKQQIDKQDSTIDLNEQEQNEIYDKQEEDELFDSDAINDNLNSDSEQSNDENKELNENKLKKQSSDEEEFDENDAFGDFDLDNTLIFRSDDPTQKEMITQPVKEFTEDGFKTTNGEPIQIKMSDEELRARAKCLGLPI